MHHFSIVLCRVLIGLALFLVALHWIAPALNPPTWALLDWATGKAQRLSWGPRTFAGAFLLCGYLFFIVSLLCAKFFLLFIAPILVALKVKLAPLYR